MKQDPCELLTSGQVEELFGRQVKGERRVVELGPACSFESLFRSPWVLLTASLPDQTSLDVLYGQQENFKFFEPVDDIAGYPALTAMQYEDTRSRGECTLDVGVSDQQSLTIQIVVGRGPNRNNPCGVAQEIAEKMVQTVKAGV